MQLISQEWSTHSVPGGKKLSGKFNQSASPGFSWEWAVPNHLSYMQCCLKSHVNSKFHCRTLKKKKTTQKPVFIDIYRSKNQARKIKDFT